MTIEPLGTDLIERYLRARGRRYFRGHQDSEFFFVADTRPRRLHVHLEINPAQVLAIRATPACYFPATACAALTGLVDAWNGQNREVMAIVHGSADPHRIGVAAHAYRRFGTHVCFDDFAGRVDRAIGAAIELFAELTVQPVLPDAG
ncbi:hypothetical protein H7H78_03765 [Mycobacterium shinjukuense]|uniref:Uncharacterized protein n=1 Tax=Mycobacterium shinjukuense TaxID=398694 RepID=A0A7I7MY76_9MYCO|nr:hypothetical protein [Mycobacterium shinjukuense]MCV6984586.1 hypothetical protein [Mycobacterium shinjukuense]ORB69291.1 hypothetical protein BST45_10265 [Mycobacterium shinjukuense]BBX76109.1 hypothetical protein MSHI_40150 [Mycobacterium shinjukuense]